MQLSQEINRLRDAIYDDAVDHGLWRQDDTLLDAAQLVRAEAMELIQEAAVTSIPSPEFCEELADVIIMCLSLAGRFRIDIVVWIMFKIRKNARRPWRHGKE